NRLREVQHRVVRDAEADGKRSRDVRVESGAHARADGPAQDAAARNRPVADEGPLAVPDHRSAADGDEWLERLRAMVAFERVPLNADRQRDAADGSCRQAT